MPRLPSAAPSAADFSWRLCLDLDGLQEPATEHADLLLVRAVNLAEDNISDASQPIDTFAGRAPDVAWIVK
jgi:hypothetical protein